MKRVSANYQRNLIIEIALHHKTRIGISRETGISEFTLRKVLDSPAPVSVNNHTFNTLDSWLKELLSDGEISQTKFT